MKQEIEQVLYAVHAAWQRRWIGLLCAWLVLLAGWLVISLLPDRFESKATVYVDTVTLLKPLLQGIAVSSNAVSEAEIIRRALLARSTLETVISETGLNKRARNQEEEEKLLASLAKALVVTGNRDTSVYYISYSDKDPRMAHAVVQHLLNTFVSNSIGADKADAESARAFLALQVADYEKRLSTSEQALAEFKKKNLGMIANAQGDAFQRLQTEQLNLERLRSDLNVSIHQRDELRRQLAGSAQAAGGTAAGSGNAAPVPPTDEQIQKATALDQRIQENQRQLDELLLKFTDQHPDVISLRATISNLERRRRTEYGAVRVTTPVANETGSPRVDNVLQDIQMQLNSKGVEIAALQEQVSQAELRVGNLRTMLATGPQIEAELASLNRGYSVTKAEYEQLLQRLESAKISGQVNTGQGVAYRVLDPPRVPLTPVAPKRALLMAAMLVVALGSGAALAWFLSQVKPTFMDVRSLRNAYELPVLGAVSSAPAPGERRARRRESALYAVGVLGFLSVGVLAVLLSGTSAVLLRSVLERGGT